MRSTIFILLLFLISSGLDAQYRYKVGGNGKRVRGNGNTITQERKVTDEFTKVEVGSAIKVELTQDRTASISVKTDENVQDYLVTRISGGELSIYYRDNARLEMSKAPVVYVSMPVVTSIDASGASSVVTTNTFSGDELELDCGGAAQIEVSYEGASVIADVGGAGRIELSGRSEKVDLDASSAGTINASDCESKHAKVDASSAASVRVNASESLDADANSAASIRYKGNPAKLFTNASSAGSVSKSRL
ncbi:MAG: head GIN domain-containing protein [Bacteroidota bacterium]